MRIFYTAGLMASILLAGAMQMKAFAGAQTVADRVDGENTIRQVGGKKYAVYPSMYQDKDKNSVLVVWFYPPAPKDQAKDDDEKDAKKIKEKKAKKEAEEKQKAKEEKKDRAMYERDAKKLDDGQDPSHGADKKASTVKWSNVDDYLGKELADDDSLSDDTKDKIQHFLNHKKGTVLVVHNKTLVTPPKSDDAPAEGH